MNKEKQKICIFGAGGRTGVKAVNQAIENGYNVLAFIHSDSEKENLPKSEEIKFIVGDVLSIEDVDNGVSGADAIISVIGHIKNSDPLMQTKGIQNIIKSMKKHEVKRLLSLTGTGVRIQGDNPSLIDKIANYLISKIDKERINDGIEHAKIIQDSNLDWTILRVLKLSTEKSNSKNNLRSYKLNNHGPAEFMTSRQKVAKILIDQIDSREYIQKMPIPIK